MKKIILTLVSLVLVISMRGQVTFEKSYDIYNSAFSDLVFTQDDGYLMAMISLKDKYYLSLVKTDLNGDTLWTRDYDRGIEYLTDLSGTEDEQGNIYLASQFGNENLLKLDKDANILWAKKYSTLKREMIVQENVLWICGNAYPGNYLYKINAVTGDSLWRSELFNYDVISGASSHATSIVALENGDVVVTVSLANSFEGNLLQSDFYRLPANSNEMVKFTLQTNEEFLITDSKSTGNEIISVANDISYLTDHKTCYFIKYTSDGTLQTFKEEVFGTITADLMKCVITNDNHLVAVGMAQTGDVLANVILHCFSLDGDSVWTQLLGNYQVTPWDLKLANDNGFVITGGFEYDFAEYKPYLIKTNSLGILTSVPEEYAGIQVQVYPNPASDQIIFHTPGMKNGTLTIVNSIGIVSSEIAITSDKTMWNCEQAEPGVFLYKILSDNKIETGKLVVKR